MKTIFNDGQSSDKALLLKGQTFTCKGDGYDGEYFQLLPDGQLGLFNQGGKMFTRATPVQ